MNRLKSITLALLSVSIAVSLAGCGDSDPAGSSTPNSGNTEPQKLTSLTYWVENHSAAAAQMKSYAEMGMYKELEKITGVKVSFQHPPLEGQQVTEQFNLMMMASNQLPDIIEYTWTKYPGGPEKAIQDGKIIKLNDYIAKYAPNLNKLLAQNPDWKKQISTDEGSIYSFPFLRGGDKVRVFYGPTIRQDWLDKLGLKVPTTIDEWYTVLKAFKERDPNGNGKQDEIPLYLDKSGIEGTPFIGAFGINYDFYQDKGKVSYGPIQPEFKQFLITMNRWYKEGLIDKDFAVPNSKLFDAKMTNNQLGAAPLYNGGGIGKFTDLMKDKDPNFKLVAAPYPVLKPGDKPIWGQRDFAFNGAGAAITTNNKNPIETVKWLDYAYGEKGELLFNYGIEGESYKMENGRAVLLSEVLNPKGGISLQQSMAKYNRVTWSAPFMISDNFQVQYLIHQSQKDALAIWSQPTIERKMPLVTPTKDDSSKFASTMTDVNTYKDEMLLKFIMGSEPLDNFDKFTKRIKDMGIDEAIKIQQAALERYNKR